MLDHMNISRVDILNLDHIFLDMFHKPNLHEVFMLLEIFFFNHLKQNDLSEVTFVMISNIFYLWLNPKIKNKKCKSAELSKWKRTRRLSALPHEQEPSVGWEFVRPRWPDCNLIISPLSDGGRCSGFSFPVVSTEATNTRSCNDVINGSESDDYVTYMDFFL